MAALAPPLRSRPAEYQGNQATEGTEVTGVTRVSGVHCNRRKDINSARGSVWTVALFSVIAFGHPGIVAAETRFPRSNRWGQCFRPELCPPVGRPSIQPFIHLLELCSRFTLGWICSAVIQNTDNKLCSVFFFFRFWAVLSLSLFWLFWAPPISLGFFEKRLGSRQLFRRILTHFNLINLLWALLCAFSDSQM